MSCLGVHFALTAEQIGILKACRNDADRREHLVEVIEEKMFADAPEFVAESDKAWDAIHRSLTDGKLTYENGVFPLNHVILGGEALYFGDDYIMSLKTPEQADAVSKALVGVTEADFRDRYFKVPETDYGMPLSEEDFQYSWNWLQEIAALFERASKANLYVLFTADQ